jgi:ATP-binding cassette subfamily B protein/ATP-binding cassette subfamily C protein CydC
LAVLGILTGTLRDLAGCWNRRQAWLVARRRCEALFATPQLKRARWASAPPLPGAALAVRFRGVTAGPLRKIDLEVAPGARIAVVGPNGAGKSTLISLAAGLESPRAGKVTVGGRSPLALGPAERRLIHRIAPESLILSGSLRRALTMGSARRQDDATVVARAEEFGLGPVLSRLGGLDGRVAEQARNLSSGEAQRIRLARASLSGARLLLLDEPETGLDADASLLVLKLLDSLGSTCVMATHDRELARSMHELWEISGANVQSDRRKKGSPIVQRVAPAPA